MYAVYLFIGRAFLILIFEKYRFAIGKIYKRQWIRVSLITARHRTSVVLSLFGHIISRYIYLFAFSFEHTNCFSVYEKEIVGFKIVLKQSLSYGYSC